MESSSVLSKFDLILEAQTAFLSANHRLYQLKTHSIFVQILILSHVTSSNHLDLILTCVVKICSFASTIDTNLTLAVKILTQELAHHLLIVPSSIFLSVGN